MDNLAAGALDTSTDSGSATVKLQTGVIVKLSVTSNSSKLPACKHSAHQLIKLFLYHS